MALVSAWSSADATQRPGETGSAPSTSSWATDADDLLTRHDRYNPINGTRGNCRCGPAPDRRRTLVVTQRTPAWVSVSPT